MIANFIWGVALGLFVGFIGGILINLRKGKND